MKYTINNYTEAEYKNHLAFEERTRMISSAVDLVIRLMDNEVYGATKYAFLTTLISYCTNIDLSELNPDDKWTFFSSTDVVERIANHLGDEVVRDLHKEFDIALKYRLSTNPITNDLMLALTDFLTKAGSEERQKQNTEAITALLSLAKGIPDEDKHA